MTKKRNEIIQKLHELTGDPVCYLEYFKLKDLHKRLAAQPLRDIMAKRGIKIGKRYYEVGMCVQVGSFTVHRHNVGNNGGGFYEVNGLLHEVRRQEFHSQEHCYERWGIVSSIDGDVLTVIMDKDFFTIETTDDNITTVVGTKDLDLYGLGKRKHKDEVVIFIEEVANNKNLDF